MFRISFTSRARRIADKLPKLLRQKLYTELRILSSNPFGHKKVEKLRGSTYAYRLRLGRWRILFVVFRKQKRIEVVDIFLRKAKSDYFRRWRCFE